MKLSSKIHGIIDYVVVVFLLASPSVFPLGEFTSIFTYVLGGIHLALTIGTDFEAGIFKLIAFRIHGVIELIVAVALVALAFYFGSIDGDVARNYYLGFGIAVFVTWL
ncbi:MAG: hypothetical protein ABJA70_16190, partial [Chryseolinea sp.]